MSASTRTLEVAVVCGLVACGGSALADDEEALPDLEFIEYLGSWEESDEDWLLVSDVTRVRDEIMQDEGSDPAPKGEESMENEDEG